MDLFDTTPFSMYETKMRKHNFGCISGLDCSNFFHCLSLDQIVANTNNTINPNSNTKSNNNWVVMDVMCGPAELLPSDPFGMDYITGNYNGLSSKGNSCKDLCDLAELLPLDPFGMNVEFSHLPTVSSKENFDDPVSDYLKEFSYSLNGYSYYCFDTFGSESYYNPRGIYSPYMDTDKSSSSDESDELSCTGEESLIHEGLQYVLGYLGVKDLLSVRAVCKSLKSVVDGDPLLWRRIDIDGSLSERITDQALLNLTQMGQGSLQSLSLVSCTKITDDGLRRILENNPKLTKLYVPECIRLSLVGLISNLRAFKSLGNPGIKNLKIGRLHTVSEVQFRELESLLVGAVAADRHHDSVGPRPRFYHIARSSLECDADRVLDVELCPACQKYKLVYDCPLESCQKKEGSDQCRACETCIKRCAQCGKCIRDCTYLETFCFEYLCSGCSKNPSMW